MAADTGPAGLDRPELAKLWQAARQRLERNGLSINSNPIRLVGLSDAEIAALCPVLSQRRPAGDTISVRLIDLDTALRQRPEGTGLLEVLESLGGALDDRKSRRSEQRSDRDATWEAARTHRAANDPDVAEWLESVNARGRLTRLGSEDPTSVILAALDTIEWLQNNRSSGQHALPLQTVATTLFGDAHALDGHTEVGSLVWDGVARLAAEETPTLQWRSFAVQLDTVSSSALAYRLPGEPGSLLAGACSAAEPFRITPRMIERGLGLALKPADIVFACENPAIVMLAADRLGTRCLPLICLEGMPSTVTGQLLALVRASGAVLRVHTDFDFGGLQIASHVIGKYGARPWRMSGSDYLQALDHPSTSLDRTVGSVRWDDELAAEMNAQRLAVHEESIADTLLDDLAM